MKLLSVKIKNFRSLEENDVTGPIDDVWTFIGQNNAGKSSVIHAIRAFYADYDITEEDFCRNCKDNPIEITLEYKLDKDEYSQLPKFYQLPENKLRVIKRFSKDNLKGEFHGFEIKDGKIVESERQFFGDKNVPIGKLGEVIYIPAVKDLSDELKKTKSSIFSKLVGRVISATLVNLPSWNELVSKAEEFAQDLRSPAKDMNIGEFNNLHEIENSLGKMLSSWKLQPQIIVSPPTPDDIVLAGSHLKFISEETKQEEDPLTLGSGAQRSIVNSLLRLWAQIESKKKKADKQKFNGQLTLLLYEEPEALLHYDQEKKLLKNFEDIVSSEIVQVIICTHSPNLVSTKNKALVSISRYVKDGSVTKIYRAKQDFFDKIKTSENVFDFIVWLNPDRNTMFFVDKVILVEGAVDKVFLNYIIQTKNIDSNVYIVDCGLKSNIPYFMQLCQEFGIKHSVMHDIDDEKNQNHLKWNQSIKTSKNTFTLEIKNLSPNLESYIGISTVSSSSKSKKPVEMLNQLKSGCLKQDKIIEFSMFIQKFL